MPMLSEEKIIKEHDTHNRERSSNKMKQVSTFISQKNKNKEATPTHNNVHCRTRCTTFFFHIEI
jgi:hypothetical protein